MRYIRLNPVRARLVSEPAKYPHSGHLGYLGRRAFGFLTSDWVLSRFHEQIAAARRGIEQLLQFCDVYLNELVVLRYLIAGRCAFTACILLRDHCV